MTYLCAVFRDFVVLLEDFGESWMVAVAVVVAVTVTTLVDVVRVVIATWV